MDNFQIKIHDKLYVGFQRNASATGAMPVGWFTPYDDNKAGQKRRDAIDNWSTYHNNGQKPLNPILLDNKAMIGFRISQRQRNAGWHSSTEYIRIEDPRGFEVDITLVNMIMLTDNNLIENGEILRECIWGRDGNFNVLLPINSTPYEQAFSNTERQKTHVNIRKLSRGDHVVLKNGISGRYMGKLHSVNIETENHYTKMYNGSIDSYCNNARKPIHYVQVAKVETVGMLPTYTYMGYASPNVSRIEKSEPMTEEQVNDLLYAEFVAGTLKTNDHDLVMLATDEIDISSALIPTELSDIITQSEIANNRGRYGALNKFIGKPKDTMPFDYMSLPYWAFKSSTIPTKIGYRTLEFTNPVFHTGMKLSREYNQAEMDIQDIDFFQLELKLKVNSTGQEYTVRI